MSTIGFLLAAIVIILIFGWAWGKFLGVHPRSKTDEQLRHLYDLCLRAGAAGERDLERVKAELRNRGLLTRNGTPRTESKAPEASQSAFLRYSSRKAYDASWKATAEKWKGNESARHQDALLKVLYQHMPENHTVPPIVEIIPFATLSPADGKQAIVEYVVWRQYPSHADMQVILAALQKLKERATLEELFEGGDLSRIEQVPWARLW